MRLLVLSACISMMLILPGPAVVQTAQDSPADHAHPLGGAPACAEAIHESAEGNPIFATRELLDHESGAAGSDFSQCRG
jgi:hypothetical protein